MTAALELLTVAQRHVSFVRVDRSIRRAEHHDGFVLAANDAWTLLAAVPEVDLDGYRVVRTADVDRVTVHVGRDGIVTRTLKAAGAWPPPLPAPVALGSLREVLDMAGAHAPIVQLELEEEDPDIAYLGRVTGVTDDEVRLLQVSHHAEWDTEPETFAVADVTQVEFGHRYAEALYALAGDPPE